MSKNTNVECRCFLFYICINYCFDYLDSTQRLMSSADITNRMLYNLIGIKHSFIWSYFSIYRKFNYWIIYIKPYFCNTSSSIFNNYCRYLSEGQILSAKK